MVNTFLPYESFDESLKATDTLRLGKQRSEVKIMLAALTGVRFKKAHGEDGIVLPERRGYQNHAATRMWRGCEIQLAIFGIANCKVWMDRFGHDYATGKGADTLADMWNWHSWLLDNGFSAYKPDWLGGPVHARYRAHLLWKDPDYYQRYGWTEVPEKMTPPYVTG